MIGDGRIDGSTDREGETITYSQSLLEYVVSKEESHHTDDGGAL